MVIKMSLPTKKNPMKKRNRKKTQTFNLSLTLPSDSPVMAEVQRLVVEEGLSIGLAIKHILLGWKPNDTVMLNVNDIVSMMAGMIVNSQSTNQQAISYSKDLGV